MITKNKLSLLLGTAMVVATATPALADPVVPGDGFASVTSSTFVGADTTTCAAPNDGSSSYVTDDAKIVGTTPTASVEASGTSPTYSVTATCFDASQDSTFDTKFAEETKNIFFGFANDKLETSLLGQADDTVAYVNVYEDGTATSSTAGVVEAYVEYTDDGKNGDPLDGNPGVTNTQNGPFTPTSGGKVATYDYEVTGQSGDAAMYYTHTEVEDLTDNGINDGTGTTTTNYQTAGGSSWSQSTGTSTFDPVSKTFDYVAVSGQYATQSVTGNTVGEFDTKAGTTSETTQSATGFSVTDGTDTTTLDVDGLSGTGPIKVSGGGASYVQVNADDVTIHGGTTSTTVVVNNSGVTVTDSTNGQTFAVDSSGNGTFAGNVGAVNGNFSGNVGVGGTLTVTGLTTLNGGLGVTGGTTTDTLAVTSTSTFTGLATFNGGAVVNGGLTTDSIVNTGALDQQGNISNSTGNVVISDNLNVNGDVAVTGSLDQQGAIFNSTGNVTVGDNLVVTGNSTVQGNSTVNGDLQVDGYATFSGPWAWVQNDLYVDDNTILRGAIYNDGGANGGAVYVNDALTVTGATKLGSSLAVTGATTTNGITNTGNIGTTTLTTTGSATIGNGLIVSAGGASITGNSTVTGTLGVTGLLTASGGVSTTTLTTSGNATIGGGLAVTGNYTTTNGNITTTNGTITGATLVSTGATSVGTNLTVGGTATVTGLLSANGGIKTNNANIAAGTGSITAGTIVINGSNGNKISGLANATLSASSTEAVTGQQLFQTNTALSALDAREAAHYAQLTADLDSVKRRAFQGVAMNFAANAAPLNLANGEAGISGGVGVFEGEWGAAIRAAGVTSGGIGLGANFGFSSDSVGGAVGASIKF